MATQLSIHTIHQNSAFEALRRHIQKVVFYMLHKERTLFLQRRGNEPSKKLILKDE